MGLFLEIGCGTGFVLSGIAEAFPEAKLVGTDAFSAGLAYAARRVPGAALYQMDARCLP
uniref:Methyltransferase n=1 Tax=Candidatus Kentrum sp. LPFa TaxID=2126335 RepID=A0A450XFU4_9GAMM|nr:MAG: Putative methyltransferase [Candidatus Kentron sp. LPFa]VFK28151.1 MAG: Putative methyltransferase [Candidatus Kentron sp. LPFa]